jgi:hypothetical protein
VEFTEAGEQAIGLILELEEKKTIHIWPGIFISYVYVGYFTT